MALTKPRTTEALALVSLVRIKKATWRADFFDHSDDISPYRSVMISAASEEDAVHEVVVQMGDVDALT